MRINLDRSQRIPSVRENLKEATHYKSAKELMRSRMIKREERTGYPFTREQFHRILDKVAQPIKKSDQEQS